jgi:hypothetical protein
MVFSERGLFWTENLALAADLLRFLTPKLAVVRRAHGKRKPSKARKTRVMRNE